MLHKNYLTWILIAIALKCNTPRDTLNSIRTCDFLKRPFQVRCTDSTFHRQHLLRAMKQGQHTIIAKHDTSIDAGKASTSRVSTKMVFVFLKKQRFWVRPIPLVWRGKSCKIDIMRIGKRICIGIRDRKCTPSYNKQVISLGDNI